MSGEVEYRVDLVDATEEEYDHGHSHPFVFASAAPLTTHLAERSCDGWRLASLQRADGDSWLVVMERRAVAPDPEGGEL